MQVLAIIAGVVSRIEVSVGQRVEAGQPLLIVESMKMEIPLESPSAGLVARILVAPDDLIAERQPLLEIEP